MRDAARGTFFVLGHAWRAGPTTLTIGWAMQLLLALVPGLQVLVIADLIERLDGTATLRDVLGPLMIVVAILGLAGPVRGVAALLREASEDAGAAGLAGAVAQRAARTPPSELAKPEVVATLHEHSESIWRGVALLPANLLFAIQDVVATLGVVLAIATLSPAAAGFTALALLPAAISGHLFAHHISVFLKRISTIFAREEYYRNLLVRQRSAVELATMGGGGWIADRSVEQWRAFVAARLALSRRNVRFDWVVGLVSTVGMFAALLTLLTDTGFSAVGVAGVSGIIAGTGTIMGAGNNIGQVLSYGPSAARLQDFVEEIPQQGSAPGRHPATIDRLQVRGLRHTYPDRHAPAVDDVSFDAARGEVIALVGANGAGKTTAVRALLGLLQPDAGSVDVDGVAPADVDGAAWLRRFGVMVQEYERYELTIRENLVLGLEHDVSDDRLWAALDLAGLATLVRSLPEQLDTQLGEQWEGTTLSGGQWQRLSLARVAVRDAPVWVLDEPTSAVDAESEEAILHRLVRERGDRITVLVSHRAWTLREVDRIYVLDAGRVVEEGSFAGLLARPGSRFGELFRNQLGTSTA